jgi:DNA-binding transcriptional regulator/RsmH inhibitor MraZ
MWTDIHSEIMPANGAYSAHNILFRSNLFSQNNKLKIYKTLVWPILCYEEEAWKIASEEINTLRLCERKIVRKIYGPIKGEET